MSVGSGSIKRAAKSVIAAETKTAEEKKAAETAAIEGKQAAETAKTKTKASSGKKRKAEEVKASVIGATSPQVLEAVNEFGQEVCRMTEELPVHLL